MGVRERENAKQLTGWAKYDYSQHHNLGCMISCVCSRSFCRYMSGFKHSKRVDLECVLQSVSTHRLYPQALACITYLKSAQPPSRLECVMNAVPSITGVSRHAHTHTHTYTHTHPLVRLMATNH